MRASFNIRGRIIESVVVFIFCWMAVNVSAATSDYSVRVSAFSKYGAETHQPDPIFAQNSSVVGASLVAAAFAGYPASSAVTSLRDGNNRGVVAVIGDFPAGEQGQGNFRAEFRDYVTFDLPDGMATANIKAFVDIAGVIGVNPGLAGDLIENWQVNAGLTFGGSGEGGIIAQDGLFDYNNPLFSDELSGEWVVTDGEPVYVRSFLSASADAISANIVLNFALPGSNALRFEMPEGTSFSSASGVLLTAVPIPAPILLLSSALIVLVGRGLRSGNRA